MLKVEDTSVTICRRPSLLDLQDMEVKLCRKPSLLDLPSINRRRNGQSKDTSRPNSRASFSYHDSNDFDASILHWDSTDIDTWLEDIELKGYKMLFKQHAITTGRRLLSLTEEHLKEIGVFTVGDRLELTLHIDELRKSAGWVSRAAFVDIPTLLNQSVFIIILCTCIINLFRLDIAKTQRSLKLYPKRIILIRHAEVCILHC